MSGTKSSSTSDQDACSASRERSAEGTREDDRRPQAGDRGRAGCAAEGVPRAERQEPHEMGEGNDAERRERGTPGKRDGNDPYPGRVGRSDLRHHTQVCDDSDHFSLLSLSLYFFWFTFGDLLASISTAVRLCRQALLSSAGAHCVTDRRAARGRPRPSRAAAPLRRCRSGSVGVTDQTGQKTSTRSTRTRGASRAPAVWSSIQITLCSPVRGYH